MNQQLAWLLYVFQCRIITKSQRCHQKFACIVLNVYYFSLFICTNTNLVAFPYSWMKWESWMKNWEGGGDMYEEEAKLLVSCINLCANRWITGEVSMPPVSNCDQYKRLSDITNSVCRQLRRQFQHNHMVRNLRKRNTTMISSSICLGHNLHLASSNFTKCSSSYALSISSPTKRIWLVSGKENNKTNVNGNFNIFHESYESETQNCQSRTGQLGIFTLSRHQP